MIDALLPKYADHTVSHDDVFFGNDPQWVRFPQPDIEGINTFEFQVHQMVTGIQRYQNNLLKILGQPYESFYS
ncbi:hypothetical protein LH67_09040 [Xenorhabdus nematophila]|nr:hypothetical protein LH67_09040 [Xenorhabdus nematophila]